MTARGAKLRILVTGATGFVGKALVPLLLQEGWFVRGAGRREPERAPAGAEFVAFNLDPASDMTYLVKGMDAVVHLAGRAHVMRAEGPDQLAQFRRVNVDGTVALAQAARKEGIKHFIFASSVKVNGEETMGSMAFTESDKPAPQDPYAVSKLEAEQALTGAAPSHMALTILRLPLMYGPQAKGNFARLMKWVRTGIPLPLASVDNRRSLLYVGNLGAAVVRLLKLPEQRSRLYLLSDGLPISTPDLIRAMGSAVSRPARLIPMPPGLLKAAGRALGMGGELRRLTGSLRIDDSLIQRDLRWRAPYSIQAALREMASTRD